jgi:hypothetical protein
MPLRKKNYCLHTILQLLIYPEQLLHNALVIKCLLRVVVVNEMI